MIPGRAGVTEAQQVELPFDSENAQDVLAVLDLRRQRRDKRNPLELVTGQQVTLSIKASDHYDLDKKPHVGESDPFPLDIVTPDELIAILEGRELNLKRRFEQILAEMTETRDALLRVQTELQPNAAPSVQEPGDDADDSARRKWSLRLLRVQRSRQQGEKSQQEVAGVAASFADIREELINNRVDTEERKIRLQQSIVEPLQQIANTQFPDWLKTIRAFETKIEQEEIALASARQTVRETNEILLAMQQVLEKMIELETYNELVDLLRSILDEQGQLMEQTERQRKLQTRSLFE
jgi:hypothetical protein